jgi:hypothetical protein
MPEREIILEQMLKVLKDIETNTCDKQFFPETNLIEKRLDKIVELHEQQVELLKKLTSDRCTCGKSKHKKEKREKKLKKEKKVKN